MIENLLNTALNDFNQFTINPIVIAMGAVFVAGFAVGYITGASTAGAEQREQSSGSKGPTFNPREGQLGSHGYNRRLANIAAILTVVLILAVLTVTAILGGMVIPGWGGRGL